MNHRARPALLVTILLTCTALTGAQDKPLTPARPIIVSVTPISPMAQELPPIVKLDLDSILPLMIGTGGTPDKPPSPADREAATRIPLNSKVYIGPMGGFESYMVAALRAKHVPLVVVSDRDQADFEITGAAESRHASRARIFVIKDTRDAETAAFTVTNLKTTIVAWTDSSDRGSARHGKKSTSEKLAKFLGEKIKTDERKYGR